MAKGCLVIKLARRDLPLAAVGLTLNYKLHSVVKILGSVYLVWLNNYGGMGIMQYFQQCFIRICYSVYIPPYGPRKTVRHASCIHTYRHEVCSS